jgi:hypothetical protein
MADSPEVKGVIGFGTKEALTGATPKMAQYAYRAVMVGTCIWSLFIEPVFTNIPISYSNHIDKGLIALTATMYAIGNMFGWVKPGAASQQTTTV